MQLTLLATAPATSGPQLRSCPRMSLQARKAEADKRATSARSNSKSDFENAKLCLRD